MTTGRYLDLFETSFVIARLPAYLKNRTSRLVKSPKLLFTDVGIAAHLAGVLAREAAREPIENALQIRP